MNRVFAQFILEKASRFDWSIQGMGFLRLYLPNNCRLHIWDSRYRVPGVSMVHDHLQWGLESTIIAGQLTNIRYSTSLDQSNPNYMFTTLKAGYGCYFKHDPKPIGLSSHLPEVYHCGQKYFQKPSEIHRTDAMDGTVTIMQKHPTKDADSARVFWLSDEQWVSAEPRKAEPDEVKDIVQNALDKWFK